MNLRQIGYGAARGSERMLNSTRHHQMSLLKVHVGSACYRKRLCINLNQYTRGLLNNQRATGMKSKS